MGSRVETWPKKWTKHGLQWMAANHSGRLKVKLYCAGLDGEVVPPRITMRNKDPFSVRSCWQIVPPEGATTVHSCFHLVKFSKHYRPTAERAVCLWWAQAACWRSDCIDKQAWLGCVPCDRSHPLDGWQRDWSWPHELERLLGKGLLLPGYSWAW